MFTGIRFMSAALFFMFFVARTTQAGEDNATEIAIEESKQDNFTEESATSKKASLSPESKANEWVIRHRDEHSGWRLETHRAIITLALYDQNYFFQEGLETKLSMKQLDLQLAVALAKQTEEHFSQGQLALYINALLALCRNPRDFYGINLVAKLYRPRNVSVESFNSKYEFALVSLTLCNAGVHLRNSHLLALIDMLPDDAHRKSVENDHEFLAVLALQCSIRSARLSYLKRYLDRALDKIRMMQDSENGGFGNIYTSALITQAMIEDDEDDRGWNKEAALSYLSAHQRPDGSFGGDILATYLALPPLIGRSLVSISRLDCKKKHATFLENEDGEEIERNRTTSVTISVWMPQSNLSEVVFAPKNSSLYDVINFSGYRFHIKTYPWGHYITGINNLEENIGQKLHWFIYKYHSSDHTVTPIKSGIDNVYIEEIEHYVFIYKK